MGKLLTKTTDVMEALGGTAAVARLTGRKLSAASNWHQSETFPSDTFLVMTLALELDGKKAPPSLWRMTQPAPQPNEAA